MKVPEDSRSRKDETQSINGDTGLECYRSTSVSKPDRKGSEMVVFAFVEGRSLLLDASVSK